MDAKGWWARCTDRVADTLRRGAWYRVLGEAENDDVMLEVRGRSVRFRRADLAIRPDPPSRWSVVVRTGVLRPTLEGESSRDVVTTYVVCPACAFRQDLEDARAQPPALTCERCSRRSDVDWSETC
jgi:hypothetical protein